MTFLLLTLWIALTALSSIVARTVGRAQLKRYPIAASILVLSILSVPATGIVKFARPHSQQLISLLQHREPPHIDSDNSCSMFPRNNVWNTSIRKLPADARSAAYIATIGPDKPLHADFGPGGGYEFAVVGGNQAAAHVHFGEGAAESDPGPYRIPDDAPIEGESDHHVLVLDTGQCRLYELFGTSRIGPKEWQASSGAVFDLQSNKLRPFGWTSADAAGLPMLPGLVRYDEVKAGAIRHALRFTTSKTRKAFVWPARHRASSYEDLNLPPMGQRFRLRSSFDTTTFSPDTRVILMALQEYGMFLADNGSPLYLSGVKDSRWPSRIIEELRQVHGSDFEAVDSSSLILDADSGAVRQ